MGMDNLNNFYSECKNVPIDYTIYDHNIVPISL